MYHKKNNNNTIVILRKMFEIIFKIKQIKHYILINIEAHFIPQDKHWDEAIMK